jgi:hypothetical protein
VIREERWEMKYSWRKWDMHLAAILESKASMEGNKEISSSTLEDEIKTDRKQIKWGNVKGTKMILDEVKWQPLLNIK